MTTKKAAAKKAPAKKAAIITVTAHVAPKMKEAAKRKSPAPKTITKKIRAQANSSNKHGLKFPDPGFHIAVLGALLDLGCISAKLVEAQLDGLDFDEDTSETERLLAAMARLHALLPEPKHVARIESLDFDGGNEIYMLLEDGAGVETGGEDDTYSLQALTGIAALSSLKRLSLDGHGYRAETLDLRPLEAHPALESLILSGKCKYATTLETLPKLARLDLALAKIDRPAVLDRLAKRGVEILRST